MGERFWGFLPTLSPQAGHQLEVPPGAVRRTGVISNRPHLALPGARHLRRPPHPCSCPCKVGTAPLLEREALQVGRGRAQATAPK